MLEQPLTGIKVLDLTWQIIGPYCTKILADFGADVIKVERPNQGDPTRRIGPFLKDDPHPEKSGLFLYLNSNKKGITLNLNTQKGQLIIKDLVKDVDILVESFSPRVMPNLGLDYNTLEKINPKLVMVSISNFGQEGPYRDFKSSELILMAMGYSLFCSGLGDQYPLKYAANVLQYEVGVAAASATLIGLRACRIRGEGEHIDISSQESMLISPDKITCSVLGYQYEGVTQYRRAMTSMPATGNFPCKDGWFGLAGYGEYFIRVCKWMDRLDLLDDPRFSTAEAMFDPDNAEAFNAIMLDWLSQHTKAEAFAKGREADLMGCPFYTMEEVFKEPHYRERDLWIEVNHPVMGDVEMPGRPFIMTESPWQMRFPAPMLGQDNEDIYCNRLGYSRQDLVRLRETGII